MPINKSCHLPGELFIGGMRIIIIDPHNHILPYWFREYLANRNRLVVVRIDAHHDMFHYNPALPAREGRDAFEYVSRLMPYLQGYCQEKVNEGNFTTPAFHCGIIAALYHFRPRDNRMDAYGRVSGSDSIGEPTTTERRGNPRESKGKRIIWDENTTRLQGRSAKTFPVPEKIGMNDFCRDMQDCILPIAVGFDLDGLFENSDKGSSSPDEIINDRLERVRRILLSVARPQFICLARSQTPRSYIPAEIVDRAQESALNLIRKVFA
ncbi:MAG: hypothetical protein PHQ34_07700 [Methanothrix sp.]|nr:hypothetical protein [Methanothrix sp.]